MIKFDDWTNSKI